MTGGTLVVTGVVDGEQAATQWRLRSGSSAADPAVLDACHRAALVAMAKPGAYRLTLADGGTYGSRTCVLSRATP
jgi:hypothetical protein